MLFALKILVVVLYTAANAVSAAPNSEVTNSVTGNQISDQLAIEQIKIAEAIVRGHEGDLKSCCDRLESLSLETDDPAVLISADRTSLVALQSLKASQRYIEVFNRLCNRKVPAELQPARMLIVAQCMKQMDEAEDSKETLKQCVAKVSASTLNEPTGLMIPILELQLKFAPNDRVRNDLLLKAISAENAAAPKTDKQTGITQELEHIQFLMFSLHVKQLLISEASKDAFDYYSRFKGTGKYWNEIFSRLLVAINAAKDKHIEYHLQCSDNPDQWLDDRYKEVISKRGEHHENISSQWARLRPGATTQK